MEGSVTDASTGALLSGVTVSIGDKSNSTGNNGIYTINNLELGSRTVTASKSGYKDYSGSCEVVSDSTISNNIQMTKDLSGEPPVGSTITINPSEITITDGSLQDIHKQRFLITVNNQSGVPLNNVNLMISFIVASPNVVLDTLVYDLNPCDGTPETTLAQLYDGDPDDGGVPIDSPFNTSTNEDGVFELWLRFISGGFDTDCDGVIELVDPADPTSDPIVFEWSADLEVTSGSSFSSATFSVSAP